MVLTYRIPEVADLVHGGQSLYGLPGSKVFWVTPQGKAFTRNSRGVIREVRLIMDASGTYSFKWREDGSLKHKAAWKCMAEVFCENFDAALSHRYTHKDGSFKNLSLDNLSIEIRDDAMNSKKVREMQERRLREFRMKQGVMK